MMTCWSCDGAIETSDNFCRHCGMGQGTKIQWYYEVWAIVVLTLFALGPFSLPLIWKTPRLGPQGRWIATVLTAVYTLMLIRSAMNVYQTARALLPL